jgi:cell division protease FtsH
LNDLAKNLLLWVVIAIVLVSVFNNFGPRPSSAKQIQYSEFISDVHNGQVDKVVIEGRSIHGETTSGERFSTYNPGDDKLVGDLLNNGVAIDGQPPEQQGLLM